MTQKKLVKKVFEACLNHDTDALARLRKKEFDKILRRREKGIPFTPKWTLVRF